LLGHFAAPANRKIVSQQALAELERAIEVIRDGKFTKRRAIVPCPGCGDELKVVGEIEGQRVYICRTCRKP
jgi:hypothetical protein